MIIFSLRIRFWKMFFQYKNGFQCVHSNCSGYFKKPQVLDWFSSFWNRHVHLFFFNILFLSFRTMPIPKYPSHQNQSIYNRSSNNIISFNVILLYWWEKKNWFPPGATALWSLYVVPMSVQVFPRDSVCLPHSKDVHVRLVGVSKLSQFEWVWVCAWVTPQWKGVLSRVGARFVPGAAEIGSGHQWPWTGISGLEKNGFLFFLIFLKCIYSSHVLQMFNIKNTWVFF